ncbi:AMP-activated protein kinase [Arabidopsis lyrata subsp. lyrata]|uniref:AMP-activated protein kinase n=1 Tax=Arabidopsis lyrata subsp. lyrata TaxID=81972 RepID=D7M0Q8_ARALL|nr:SNF1-related protein kinase regulatory subunit beta-1 isoform X1 [Arabidopsis lyrata subsp. lyrata]XP_020877392.1 SNF1-related protein kinase regulatory subunit beta-1 isoform X1 [Arabidopsis lyrata subsp. lyrata]EFH48231.1 AMP-activated protein kinase [Arabidopsis lyrata subsp. lyrata]|eukprot:XP_020877391.1 SNF1-related protein kinase regulatory subunit beta-1 isoform X1 [Arabidopsis lyrata subsp. lyrata]
MGNANGKEDDATAAASGVTSSSARSNGGDPSARSRHRRPSSDSMSSSPPGSPARSPSPFLFAPQPTLLFHVTSYNICSPMRHLFHCLGITCVPNGCISCRMVPVAPLQRANAPPSPNNIQWNQSQRVFDNPPEQGIPTIITWNQGGNDVAVEGSWDNWRSRKKLQKSGKDHSILFVLPSGIYHYKVIVDGESKYIPDLPFVSNEIGNVCNILDVHNFVPENPESIVEFEAPPSPDHSYGQTLPAAEDYAKEPLAVPPQLHLTLLGTTEETAVATKPQHVVLNHVFIEQGWTPQSIVALGLTHRFESKYITVVLYKPLTR